jgi:hypothetical protein
LGAECKEGASILKESDYANSILLGMPLVQAYTAEKGAPPFGVHVHESVRAFGQIGTHRVTVPLWRWWSKNADSMRIAAALVPSLRSYFEWCRKNPVTSGYPPHRIDAHRVLAEEYFGEFDKRSASGTSAIGIKESKLRKSKIHKTIQSERDTVPGPDRQIAKLRKILNLGDEQVEQIKPVIEAREAKLNEVRKDKSLNKEVRGLKIIDLIDESKATIQSFLNEAQKNILIEREQVHKANNKEDLESRAPDANTGG